MARFSLSSHPWELIFMYRVHNSTVSRQLRYALTKERLCCMAVTPATYAPYAVAEMGEDVCAPAVCAPVAFPYYKIQCNPHLLRSIRSHIRVCIGHLCSIVCQSDSLSVVGNNRSALIHSVEQLLCKSRRHIDTSV